MQDEPDDYIVRFMEPPTGSLATLGADARLVATGVFAAMRPERLLLGALVLLLFFLAGSLGDASSPTSMPPVGAIATDPTLSDLFREHVEEFERPHGWETPGVDGFEVQAAFATADPEVRSIVERLRRRGTFESFTSDLRGGLGRLATGVVHLDPSAVVAGVDEAIFANLARIWTHDRGFLVVFGMLFLLLISMFGGAIARLDAERFGRDRDVPAFTVIRWTIRDLRRLWGATLLPPVLAIILLIPAFVLGLVALIPGVDVLVAIGWIAALVFAFAAALVLTAWIVSLPILSAAAACESGDPSEIVVRTAGLIRMRPGRFLVLIGTAVVTGVVGWLLVSGVATITLEGARAAGGFFGGPTGIADGTAWPSLDAVPVVTESTTTGTRWLAVGILDGWRSVVTLVAMGWLIAFCMVSGTRTYLLLRRSVESLRLDELGSPGPESD
ncbi:MAG: hypothetical protein CMJ27_08880 [Phycisphaerae bacterium]|nr:hypothetical protein [Phycisphaerae bacterium]OUX01157.1 MAG: hypothetical protein CBD91_05125 [Phycisphaeraceae bacterium TMED231]